MNPCSSTLEPSHGAAPSLRFALVTTFYPPYHFGGDAVAVRRLAHALARSGHQVDVIHDVDAFYALRSGDEPIPLQEPPGVRVHRLHSRLGILSLLATHQTGRPMLHAHRLRALLDGGDYDVIHFHNISLIGAGALAYGNAVKLYTANEYWLVCPTHGLYRNNREICDAPRCLRCVLHYRRPPQPWRWTALLERQLRHIDQFIAPSKFCAEAHRARGFPHRFAVLPYFLPDAEFDGPSATPAADVPPHFLFVGRLEKTKGLQDLIPLFDDTAPADLLVVGSGPYEAELRRLAATRPRVHFLGGRTSAQLPALYARAIALIVPSVFYETFGLVTVEAFRERTPVIARRLGPLAETVEASDGGLLFEDRDGLREAMHRIAADPALRQRLGENGYRAYREIWNEAGFLSRYLALIAEAAQRRGATDLVQRLAPAASTSAPAP